MNEFPSNFKEFDTSRFTKRDWEQYIVKGTNYTTFQVLTDADQVGSFLTVFKYPVKGPEADIFRTIYKQEERYGMLPPEEGRSRGFLNLKSKFYSNLAKEVRGGNFSMYRKLEHSLESNRTALDPMTYELLNIGLDNIYLMYCEPDKFLVGLKNEPLWKKIKISVDPTDKEGDADIVDLAMSYRSILSRVDRRGLTVVPEMWMNPQFWPQLHIPKPAKDVETLLEEAFYKQRYIVPPEGAEVRFRKAGDLKSMTMLQSGDYLFSRIVTTYGDQFFWINMENGFYDEPVRWKFNDRINVIDKLGGIVAETYRDLVIAEEISTTQYKSLRLSGQSLTGGHSFPNDIDPQIIYIPRTVKVGQPVEPRLLYTGPTRPVQPHKVSGYVRRGNMTEEHKKELIQFEQRLGIKFVDQIPAGKTFVRPYVSPMFAGDEEIMDGPIFIKRRIETQIRELLHQSSNT